MKYRAKNNYIGCDIEDLVFDLQKLDGTVIKRCYFVEFQQMGNVNNGNKHIAVFYYSIKIVPYCEDREIDVENFNIIKIYNNKTGEDYTEKIMITYSILNDSLLNSLTFPPIRYYVR